MFRSVLLLAIYLISVVIARDIAIYNPYQLVISFDGRVTLGGFCLASTNDQQKSTSYGPYGDNSHGQRTKDAADDQVKILITTIQNQLQQSTVSSLLPPCGYPLQPRNANRNQQENQQRTMLVDQIARINQLFR